LAAVKPFGGVAGQFRFGLVARRSAAARIAAHRAARSYQLRDAASPFPCRTGNTGKKFTARPE